jgi:glycosyltransferase involved in cell wall biosynthesis
MFVQSVESRFYEERHFYERFAAEQVLALPVGYIVVAQWIGDLLRELRPDAGCVVVRNGIDKDVFAPRPAANAAGPLRILIDGQPSMWFKGVPEAIAAVRAMSMPVEATIAAADPSAADGMDGVKVTGGLDAAGMAALYADHDVVLKLSRVEGLALGPIEAFHVGTPAVVTPHTGHEEYVEHGRNGLVVGFDDLPGTARVLDSLAADRERLRSLSEGALATAARWPSAEAASAAFTTAVEGLVAGPAPDVGAAFAHLQRAQRRWLELGREHARQEGAVAHGLRGAIRWHADALADAAATHRRLEAQVDANAEHVRELQRTIDEITSTRAYRAALSLRKLKPGGNP